MRRLLASALVAVIVLATGACGGDEADSSATTEAEPAATEAGGVPDYLMQLNSIKVRADDARSDYHNAPIGDPTIEEARDLAEICGKVADELEGLKPPESHAELHTSMIESFR